MRSGSQELIGRLSVQPQAPLCDWTLELNTSRTTSPVYHKPTIKAGDSVASWTMIQGYLKSLGAIDGARLTLGGRGDPLLSPALFDVIAEARRCGIEAIHIETDLAAADESLAVALAQSEIDVVTVLLPALTPVTYAAVMGTDAMATVLNNIKAFVTERARRARGVPILVPTFVKLAANLAEMDAWYDQWLTAVGAAVIVGPRLFGSPELELADMSAARGKAARPARVHVSAEGHATVRDDDNAVLHSLGSIGDQSIEELLKAA
jgi:hypothetical protein